MVDNYDGVDDIDDIVDLETLWETGGESSFSSNDHLLVAMDLRRPSSVDPSSDIERTDLMWDNAADIISL